LLSEFEKESKNKMIPPSTNYSLIFSLQKITENYGIFVK